MEERAEIGVNVPVGVQYGRNNTYTLSLLTSNK